METNPISPLMAQTRGADASPERLAELREAAIRLEAGFLAEMLKGTGVGMPRDSFGGGAGEEQFASVLRNAQADRIAEAGGVGLAEQIFEAMKARYNV